MKWPYGALTLAEFKALIPKSKDQEVYVYTFNPRKQSVGHQISKVQLFRETKPQYGGSWAPVRWLNDNSLDWLSAEDRCSPANSDEKFRGYLFRNYWAAWAFGLQWTARWGNHED